MRRLGEHDLLTDVRTLRTFFSAAGGISTINFMIDGGGGTIAAGVKGDLVVDFACTIQSVTTLADQSGSIVVDIWDDG